MSNFLSDIKSKTRAEWEPAYVDYGMINRILEAFKIVSILYKYIIHQGDQEIDSVQQLTKYQQQNLQVMGVKLQQVILFQRRKLDSFVRYKTYQLYSSWILIQQAMTNLSSINFKQHEYYDQRKNIKQAIQVIYQNTSSLIKFVNLNNDIVEHIYKQIATNVKPFYDWQEIDYTFFIKRNEVQHFMLFVNKFYGQQFCSVYNQNQLDLLTIDKVKQAKPKQFFLMGLFIGFALLLLFIMILSFFLNVFEPDFWAKTAQAFKYIFPMFRGVGLFILYMWGCSWNVWGFTNYGVNYRLILKMGIHYSAYIQIMKRAGFFTMVLLIMVILYLTGYQYSNTKHIDDIPIEYTPLVVYILFFTYIFFPVKNMFNPKGRQYFYTILRNIILSPFITMTFIIAFTTDQLVSFVGPLKDLAYTICYYTSDFSIRQVEQCLAYNTLQGVLTGYIVALIPLMFRMIQCFNQARQTSGKFFGHIQMWNFFKYTSSMITATLSFLNKFNPNLLIPFLFSSVISTCYAYYWDLKHDWGFLEKGSKYKILRTTLSYKNPTLYYVAIVVNFLLRCAWTLTISSFVVAKLQSTLLVFVTSFLQIFRRCMWNFFRIEKQHLANCKDFRTTQSIEVVLKSTPLKGALRKNSQQSDYYTRLDAAHPLALHRKMTVKTQQIHGQTNLLIHNTTSQMVTNALSYFKQMIKKQQDENVDSFIRSMKNIQQSVGKAKLILASYKLKQD